MINATMISAPHILHYTISTRLGCPATELFNKTAPHLNLVRACACYHANDGRTG